MIDQVTLDIVGGVGGRGAVSFRREKFVPEGGPDGGHGGRGGHVILIGNRRVNTLGRYRRTHRFAADLGQPGGTNKKRGRDGADLILEVPAGTVVHRLGLRGEPEEQIADLAEEGEGVLVARGGRGGHGNSFFRSSTNRAPRVAQRGQQGQRATVRLELRLIADVGLVGLPNAGKSTLLRQLSAARPRVAAYPFTTIEPYLGVVPVGWEEFVLADLPGLIEGAAVGAGLGHDFLRHTARTRVLVHVVDAATDDPLHAIDVIDAELRAYDADLAARPQIVVLNKIDQPAAAQRLAELRGALQRRGLEATPLSALVGDGADLLVQRCWGMLQELRREAERAADAETVPALAEIRPRPDRRRYRVEREGAAFRIHGDQVQTFVEMMDTEDDAALEEVYRWLERRGVAGALRKAGLVPGDRVRVGAAEWAWDA